MDTVNLYDETVHMMICFTLLEQILNKNIGSNPIKMLELFTKFNNEYPINIPSTTLPIFTPEIKKISSVTSDVIIHTKTPTHRYMITNYSVEKHSIKLIDIYDNNENYVKTVLVNTQRYDYMFRECKNKQTRMDIKNSHYLHEEFIKLFTVQTDVSIDTLKYKYCPPQTVGSCTYTSTLYALYYVLFDVTKKYEYITQYKKNLEDYAIKIVKNINIKKLLYEDPMANKSGQINVASLYNFGRTLELLYNMDPSQYQNLEGTSEYLPMTSRCSRLRSDPFKHEEFNDPFDNNKLSIVKALDNFDNKFNVVFIGYNKNYIDHVKSLPHDTLYNTFWTLYFTFIDKYLVGTLHKLIYSNRLDLNINEEIFNCVILIMIFFAAKNPQYAGDMFVLLHRLNVVDSVGNIKSVAEQMYKKENKVEQTFRPLHRFSFSSVEECIECSEYVNMYFTKEHSDFIIKSHPLLTLFFDIIFENDTPIMRFFGNTKNIFVLLFVDFPYTEGTTYNFPSHNMYGHYNNILYSINKRMASARSIDEFKQIIGINNIINPVEVDKQIDEITYAPSSIKINENKLSNTYDEIDPFDADINITMEMVDHLLEHNNILLIPHIIKENIDVTTNSFSSYISKDQNYYVNRRNAIIHQFKTDLFAIKYKDANIYRIIAMHLYLLFYGIYDINDKSGEYLNNLNFMKQIIIICNNNSKYSILNTLEGISTNKKNLVLSTVKSYIDKNELIPFIYRFLFDKYINLFDETIDLHGFTNDIIYTNSSLIYIKNNEEYYVSNQNNIYSQHYVMFKKRNDDNKFYYMSKYMPTMIRDAHGTMLENGFVLTSVDETDRYGNNLDENGNIKSIYKFVRGDEYLTIYPILVYPTLQLFYRTNTKQRK